MPFTTLAVALGALTALNGVGWSVATTAQLALLVARRPPGVSTAEAMGWFSGATALGNVAAGVMGGGIADLIGLRPSLLRARRDATRRRAADGARRDRRADRRRRSSALGRAGRAPPVDHGRCRSRCGSACS